MRPQGLSTRLLIVVCCALLVGSASLQARTIDKLDVSKGYEDDNTIGSPLYDAAGVRPLSVGAFTESFDRNARVFERRSGFSRGGVKSKLGAAVRPADEFAALLRTEAEKMGLPLGDGGWTVNGDIRGLKLDNDLPSAWAMGALLFYGTFEVRLEVVSPEGETTVHDLVLRSYSVQGGMNGLASARRALAALLIEGAQETLSLLNAEHFGAAPHASMAGHLATVRSSDPMDVTGLLHVIGLSGYRDAVPVLLEKLPGVATENGRSHLILALGRLRAGEAVKPLASRYEGEEDDCRWYTLKALDYIGTDAALAAVREKGTQDREEYYRTVAQDILARR